MRVASKRCLYVANIRATLRDHDVMNGDPGIIARDRRRQSWEIGGHYFMAVGVVNAVF